MLSLPFFNSIVLDLSKMSPDELKETQTIMEEKIYRIWTILSAFEGKWNRMSAFSFSNLSSPYKNLLLDVYQICWFMFLKAIMVKA